MQTLENNEKIIKCSIIRACSATRNSNVTIKVRMNLQNEGGLLLVSDNGHTLAKLNFEVEVVVGFVKYFCHSLDILQNDTKRVTNAAFIMEYAKIR